MRAWWSRPVLVSQGFKTFAWVVIVIDAVDVVVRWVLPS